MKRFLRRRIPLLLILLLLCPLGYKAWNRFREQHSAIPPSGGEAFTGFVPLRTTFYAQTDPRWQDEKLGGSGESLAHAGCTVVSVSMALSRYGITMTPADLNRFLKEHDGYTSSGLIKWETVAKAADGKLAVDYRGQPQLEKIDNALNQGHPALVKILLQQAVSHWVLVVGKEGQEYLVRDPLGNEKDLSKLSEFGSRIYAVRVIKPTGQ